MKNKLHYIIVLFLISLLPFLDARANEYLLFYEIDPHYTSRIEGSTFFQQLTIYQINDSTGYSLEADLSFTQVIATKDETYLNQYTEEERTYLEQIAYYGYDYNKTKKRYMATQELIWEYVNNIDVYWLDEFNNRVDLEKEKSEILNLAQQPIKQPNFEEKEIEGLYFQEFTLTDLNDSLDNYEIIHDSSNIVQKEENQLKIKIRDAKETEITLRKKVEKETMTYTIFRSPHIVTFGVSENIEQKIKIVPLNKPNAYIEISFLENNKPITGVVTFTLDGKTYQTDNNGHFVSDNTYEEGIYEVEVLETPKEYLKIFLKFNVSVSEKEIDDDQRIRITSQLQRKNGSIAVIRTGMTMQEEIPLKDVTFELYAQEDILDHDNIIYPKDTLVLSKKTDENGSILFSDLPLGTYYLKEIAGHDYIESMEKKDLKIDGTVTSYYEKISTPHIPLNITIIDDKDYTFLLYDENNHQIATLKSQNTLYLEYGKYSIIVLKDDKKLYTWDIDFSFEKQNFTFYTKDYMEPILFDMPKTGKKKSNLFFYMATTILMIIFIKK